MPTLRSLLDLVFSRPADDGAGRRRTRLAVEPLERRVVLAADFTDGGRVAQLAWQGELVDVKADSWIIRATTGTGDVGSGLVAGWSAEPLGEGFYALTAPGAGTIDVLGWADATGWVEYVEPDFLIVSAGRPDDTLFSQLWGLANSGDLGGIAGADIAATAAWDVTTGSREVVIAVIDTGVDYTHPDLAANIWRNPREIAGNGRDDDGNGFADDVHGWNFVARNGRPRDDHGHGTHVAGTIGAVGGNGTGVTGVSWRVSIMGLKFLDANGSGTTANAIAAINYATRMRRDFGINIVATNNSWGGGGFSVGLQDAIAAGGRAGILFVAAAGNDRSDNDLLTHYPSNYPDDAVIAVAATDRSDRLARFSNFGATSVDIAAPGSGIISTVLQGSYASYSGTSMAAPHVTGTVALMAAANPAATAAEIRAAILATARPVAGLAGRVATGGVVSAAAAVRAILPTGPDDPGPPPAGEPGDDAGSVDDPPATDPPPPPPAPRPVVDAGDSFKDAGRVEARSGEVWLTGTVGDGRFRSRDVDLFRVRVAAGQTLVVEVLARRLPRGSSLDSYLRVFDGRGRQLAVNDDHGGTVDSRIVLRPRQTGWYLIGVSGYGNARYDPRRAGSGRAGSTGDYGLLLRFSRPAGTPATVHGMRPLGEPDPTGPAGQEPPAEILAALAGHVAATIPAAQPAAAPKWRWFSA